MNLEDSGHALIAACQQHLMRTMQTMPDCAPGGRGVGSVEIERTAGFNLSLGAQDNWLTWSLLRHMTGEGAIEIVKVGRVRYRLKASSAGN
jgi:hypothetical protein